MRGDKESHIRRGIYTNGLGWSARLILHTAVLKQFQGKPSSPKAGVLYTRKTEVGAGEDLSSSWETCSAITKGILFKS